MISSFSRKCLEIMLAAFPEFEQAGSVKLLDGYVEITQVAPSGWHLLISSEDELVTVRFAEHSIHFGEFALDNDEQKALSCAEPAVALIRGIISEGIEIAAWKNSDNFFMMAFFNVAEGAPVLGPDFEYVDYYTGQFRTGFDHEPTLSVRKWAR
ncbi:MAG: hypothetical protein ACRYFX_23510 [Janthinobacterium lividum]